MINAKIIFWLWAGWVASYLQRSLSAQVNGGSRCHLWPLKTVIFCSQGLRGGYPGNGKFINIWSPLLYLTHWGRVMHICTGKLTIIGSNNGLLPEQWQAIIWTNGRILLIGPLGTNFSEILIEIHIFSFKKMHLKMSSGKWWPLAKLCIWASTQWVIMGSDSGLVPIKWQAIIWTNEGLLIVKSESK